MNRLSCTLFGLIASFLLLTGCDESPAKPEFSPEISIFGFLWGGESLSADHAILITYTQPADAYYDVNTAAVRDAQVLLTDIRTGTALTLSSDEDNPAYYYNPEILIEPGETYELSVITEKITITAKTTIPPQVTFETELSTETVNNAYHENLGYEKPVYIECPVEDQLIIVDMYCNETWQNAEYIYPFSDARKNPQSREEYDGGEHAEPRHIYAIVPYNLLASPDFGDRHTIFWYASMIVFYGSNTMQILAMDDNYHHYLTDEHPELSGGVVNGIGCFGSVCGQTYELNIMKP